MGVAEPWLAVAAAAVPDAAWSVPGTDGLCWSGTAGLPSARRGETLAAALGRLRPPVLRLVDPAMVLPAGASIWAALGRLVPAAPAPGSPGGVFVRAVAVESPAVGEVLFVLTDRLDRALWRAFVAQCAAAGGGGQGVQAQTRTAARVPTGAVPARAARTAAAAGPSGRPSAGRKTSRRGHEQPPVVGTADESPASGPGASAQT